MTKSSSCWRHPTQCLVGVCASCLRERLTELICAEERYFSPQRCSFDSNASSTAVPVAAAVAETGEDDVGNVVTVSTLIEADQVEAEYRNGLAAEEQGKAVPTVLPRSASSVLQRTRSWSHMMASSRQQPQQQRKNGYVENRDKDGKSGSLARILSGKDDSFSYGDHSLPGAFEPILGSKEYVNGINGKFEFAETPKGHYKASSWPEIESQKQQHQHHRKGSWIASFFGFRSKSKESQESKSGEKSRKGLFGLRRKKKAPASAVEDISCSPGKMNQTECDEFEQRRRKGSPPSEQQANASYDQQGRVTNRVTPVSSNGDLYSNPRLSKMRSVNWSHYSKPPKESWGKTLSTPLRLFTNKGNGRKSKDELDLEGYAQDEDKRSWSVSSPAELKRFHPSPALPTTSYTAYYRDYGASWSLHSSPMPGKGRWNHHHQNHRGGRPWENREAFHAHSSPFHAAGSNTWNFYLTPLRPVRNTTSRHR